MITDDLIILKEPSGSRSLIPLGKELRRDVPVKEGLQVAVEVTAENQAKAVTIRKVGTSK